MTDSIKSFDDWNNIFLSIIEAGGEYKFFLPKIIDWLSSIKKQEKTSEPLDEASISTFLQMTLPISIEKLLNFGEIEDQKEIELLLIFFQKVIELIPSIQNNLNIELVNSISKLFDAETKIFQKNASTRFFTKIFNFFASQQNDLIDVIKSMNPAENINYCYYNCLMLKIYYNIKQNKRRDKKTDLFTHSIVNFFIQFIQTNISNFHFFSDKKNFEVFTNAFNTFLNLLDDNEIPNLYCFLLENLLNESIKVQKFICGCLSKLCKIPKYAKVIHKIEFESPKIIDLLLSNTFCPKVLVEFEQFIQFLIEEGMTDKNFIISFWKIYHESELFDANETYIDLIVYSLKFIEFESFDEFIDFVQKFPNFYHFLAKIVFKFQNYDEKEEITIRSLKNLLDSSFTNEIAGKELLSLINQKLDDSIIKNILPELFQNLINEDTIDISCLIMDSIITSSSDPLNIFDYDQLFELINENNENAIIHILIQFHLKSSSVLSNKLITLLHNKQEIVDDTWNLLKNLLANNTYQYAKDFNKLLELAKKQNLKNASLSFIKFLKILIFKYSNKYFLDTSKKYPVKDLHCQFRILKNSIIGLDIILNAYLENENENNILSARKFLLKVFDGWSYNSVNFLNRQFDGKEASKEKLKRFFQLILELLQNEISDPEDLDLPRHLYPNNYLQLNIKIKNCFSIVKNYFIHFDQEKSLKSLKERISRIEETRNDLIFFDDFPLSQENKSLVECGIKNNKEVKVKIISIEKTSNFEKQLPLSYYFSQIHFEDKLLTLLDGNEFSINSIIWQILQLLPTSKSIKNLISESSEKFNKMIMETENNYKKLYILQTFSKDNNIFDNQDSMNLIIDLFQENYLKLPIISTLSSAYKTFHKFYQYQDISLLLIQYLNQVECEDYILIILELLTKMSIHNNFDFIMDNFEPFEKLNEKFYDLTADLFFRISKNNQLNNKLIEYCKSKIINDFDNSRLALKIINVIYKFIDESQINPIYDYVIRKFQNYIDIFNEKRSLSQLIYISDIFQFLSRIISKFPSLIKGKGFPINYLMNIAFNSKFKENQKFILNILSQYLKIEKDQKIKAEIISNMKELIDNSNSVCNYDPSIYSNIESYTGLTNLGSTCYINSVFQQFFHLFPVRYLLSTSKFKKQKGLKSIQKIMIKMAYTARPFIDTSEFIKQWKGWKNELIDPKKQQDSMEFYQYLVDSFPKQIKDLFNGEMVNYINNDISMNESFYSINIPVANYDDIYSSFENYNSFNEEIISSKIKKLPPILVIQLQRFSYENNTLKKINNVFEFPIDLDIEQICIKEKDQNQDEFHYKLNGIIIHKGVASSGHFISLIRKEDNWWCFNDNKVSKIDTTDVKELSFGRKENGTSAYILFYTQVLDVEIKRNKKISFYEEFNYQNEIKNLVTILNDNDVYEANRALYLNYVNDFVQSIEDPLLIIEFLFKIFCHSIDHSKCNSLVSNMKKIIKEEINSIDSSSLLLECADYLIDNFDDILDTFLNCSDKNLVSNLSSFILFFFNYLDKIMSLPEKLILIDDDDELDKISSPSHEKSLIFFKKLGEQIITKTNPIEKISQILNLINPYISNHIKESFKDGWSERLIKIINIMYGTTIYKTDFSKLNVSNVLNTLNSLLLNYHDPESDEVVDLLKYGTEIKSSESNVKSYENLINESIIPIINQINENKEFYEIEMISPRNYLLLLENLFIFPKYSDVPKYSLLIFQKTKEILIFVGKCQRYSCDILLKAKVSPYKAPVLVSNDEETTLTELVLPDEESYVYCITIPEIGEVLVAQNGNVLLNHLETSCDFYLKTDDSVVINSGKLDNLYINTANVIISNESDSPTLIKSLNIKHNDMPSKLFISKNSILDMGSIDLKNSLIVNFGTLMINNNSLYNSSIINNGKIIAESLDNLRFILNTRLGTIHSEKYLQIQTTNIYNYGEIDSEKLNIIADETISNHNNIKIKLQISIFSEFFENYGLINAFSGVFLGSKFRQFSKGQIHMNGITFYNLNVECEGAFNIKALTFSNNQINHSNFSQNIASFDNCNFPYYGCNLHVKKGCEIMFGEKNKLGDIWKLNNQGNLIIKAEISYISNLENELSGKLLFMRKTNIYSIENKGHIVVLGESNGSAGGSLYVQNDCYYDNGKFSESKYTLCIYNKYNGLKDSTLEIANGGIIYAFAYESQGLTFCHNYFNINTDKNICCYGLVASQDGITLSYQNTKEALNLNKKIIEPMIEGGKKIFKVISPFKIEIRDDFNRNVDITLKTKYFYNYSKLIANNIKIESSSFTNKGQISSSNDIEINCKDFYNISGRIEAHKKIDIEAEESFENCGGGKIQKSITEYIKVHETEKCEKYIDRNVGLYGTESRIRIKETSQKITKYIYYPQLEKSGVIATDNGSLKIHSRCINNSFGIMNAKKGILLDGNDSIENKCGLIYSGYFLQISSKKFRNGFCENPQTITNYNPEKPKISKIKFIGYIHPLLSYIEPPVYVFEQKNCDPYIYDYERNDLKVGGSKYPGYLFAQDNIKILSETDVYLGTIVSGKNISIRGRNTSSQSSDDIGTIVANGNVFMEMERASLNHARIQAENITIKLLEDLTIEGIIQPIVLLDGSVVCILDLNKFAQIIGILSKNPSMAQKFIKYTESSLKETGMSGFIGKYPTTEKFLSSLPDKQMEELAKLFLAPIHGRKILQNQNLVRSLEYSGAKSTNATKAINYAGDNLDLIDNAMIVYQKSDEKQTIIGENGEKEIVSVFNPQLVFSSMCKISSLIGAAKKASIETMKSIKINPGNFTPESDLSLKAGEKISILSQYKYNEKGERINPVNIISKNELTLSGDKGVETKGVNISSKKLNIISSHGDVIDNGVTVSYKSNDSYDKISYEKRSTCTSSFCAQDSVLIKGNNIKLNGTNISSGNGGIKFSAENVELRPSYETFNCEKKTKRTKFIHQEKIVIPQSIVTTGIIDFDARNVNMFSPYIVANKIRNNCDGDFNILADRNYLYRYNYYKKRRFLGSCVKEQTQINSIVKPAEIIAKEIESLGVGTVKIEGVIMKSINMIITKNFIEKTAYDEFFYKEKNRRRGFFAPKIKGDPMKDSIKSLRGSTGGDVASHGLSLASTAFQTCSHIKTLTHLSSLPNPVIQLSSILLSRFTTCALYCDMKQTTKVTEKVPIQSNVEVGFFYLKNDRTHLEGIWNIDKATIETNLLTAESPKKTIEIENYSKSFCIEFNVAGILSSLVIPCSTVTKLLVKLPAVGNSEAKSSEKAESNFPMQLNAEAIFIRCNNAVFSGSQIRSKLIDIIVEKKLTIESLTNLFDSKSQSSCFKVAVSSLFNSVSNETLSSSVFGKSLQKIPMIRIANKSIMSEKVDAIAQLVGTERFYLKVGELLYTNPSLIGLISEGKFVETENEQIFINEAQSVKINEIYKEKSSVINPSINEMFSLMGQIDDYKRIYSNTMKNAMSKSSAVSEVNNEISSYLNNKETQKSYLQMKDDLKELNESIEKVSEILYEENLPHDIIDNKYQKASEMVENYIHKSLNSVSVLCSKNEKFLQKNSKMERIYNYSISSMLHNSIDQILKVPMIFCKESLSKYQTKFSSICQSKKMVANLIEEMPEKIVDYAMSFGSNEDEARDFSNAMILGMKNIIKEKNDISENINYPNLLKNKLKKIEENNLVNLKENYSNIEKLRCESQQALCEFVEKETLKRMKFTPPDLFYN